LNRVPVHRTSTSKYAALSAVAVILIIAAAAIVSFDASNIDIARPPSLEKLVPSVASTQASPSPGEPGDWQSNMASFIADPLNRYAVYLLGRTSGDGSIAADHARLLSLAADRSRRDVEIQTMAVDRFLAEDSFPQALERLDGLIRSNPGRRTRLFDALLDLAQNAGNRGALVGLLAQSPPWRKDFLTYIPRSAASAQNASLLMTDLRSTRSPPQSSELAPFISKLIDDGAIDQAYSFWLNALTEAQLERAGNIYNGDFEAELAQLGPFDWVVVPTRNVVARTVRNTSADRGTVLELYFAGSEILYRNVYQRLMLPPGRYTLTGAYRANNLENDRGFVWRIYCNAAGKQMMGESPAMKGTRDWGPFVIDFTIPDTGCTSQILRLELNARAKLDLRVRGILRFDDLKIDRQETDSQQEG